MARELDSSILSENERIVLDYYCAGNQKGDTLRLLRRLDGDVRQLTDDGVKKAASKFFSLNRVKIYIESKEHELARIYQQRAIKNAINLDEERINLATINKDEARGDIINRLQDIADDENSTAADKLSALSKIIEYRAAKEKDEREMSEFQSRVMFTLPADLCEGCPHKEEIYAEYGYPATQEEIEEAFYKNNKS